MGWAIALLVLALWKYIPYILIAVLIIAVLFFFFVKWVFSDFKETAVNKESDPPQNSLPAGGYASSSSADAELAQITAEYSPEKLISIGEIDDFEDSRYLNRDILSAIRNYRREFAENTDRINNACRQLSEILSCRGCLTSTEKVRYLKQNSSNLKHWKKIIEHARKEMSHRKIELLHENEETSATIKNAILALQISEKCVSSDIALKYFLPSKKPAGLSVFLYENDPIIISMGTYTFCLFTNVILVFDNQGGIVSALDPTALTITVKHEGTTDRCNKYIGKDSKSILLSNFGWQRVASQDTEISEYEYGTIDFKIERYSCKFTVSSSRALSLFEHVAKLYSLSFKAKHESIPNLLNLLNAVSDGKEEFTEAFTQYLSDRKKQNYFCREIDVL